MKVRILRQRRKTLTVYPGEEAQSILVKVPYGYSEEEIMKFLSSKSEKISRMLALDERVRQIKAEFSLSTPEGRAKRRRALSFFTGRTRYWSEKTGLFPKSVGISSAETRYGSCNRDGRIVFSVLLTAFPTDEIDAVIVHELCHLKYMNHGESFYGLLEGILPDYKDRIRRMKGRL